MGPLKTLIGPRVYLDSNIFIYQFEDFPDAKSKLAPLFERFDRGELRAVVSELALGELLVKPFRAGDSAAAESYSQLLTMSSAMSVHPVTRDVLIAAARLRADHPPFKLPDAIHAATALQQRCTTFLTNDAGFTTVPGLPVLLLSDMS